MIQSYIIYVFIVIYIYSNTIMVHTLVMFVKADLLTVFSLGGEASAFRLVRVSLLIDCFTTLFIKAF